MMEQSGGAADKVLGPKGAMRGKILRTTLSDDSAVHHGALECLVRNSDQPIAHDCAHHPTSVGSTAMQSADGASTVPGAVEGDGRVPLTAYTQSPTVIAATGRVPQG